jgi:hypothetical protein
MASSSPITQLFTTIEHRFSQSENLDAPNRWYLLATAALVGSHDPELTADLYVHLLTKPSFSTPPQRQALIRRIREALVKSVPIAGVCKPLEAIMAINKHEQEEDKDKSPSTREGWQCDEENLERGMNWMRKTYTRNTESTLSLFQDHKDFEWISKNITYGLFLSDRQILDDVDTEIIVLTGIMIQNLPKETHWHMRGIRRLGVLSKDVQIIWDSVHDVAKFTGQSLHRLPTVEQVESDV